MKREARTALAGSTPGLDHGQLMSAVRRYLNGEYELSEGKVTP